MLRECLPPTMCHISYIMCQVSGVTHQLGFGGSVINGVYPVEFQSNHNLLVKHLVVQQHFFLDLKLIKMLGTRLWTNKSYFQEI